eukprot:6455605-Amphidinium_carterae.2
MSIAWFGHRLRVFGFVAASGLQHRRFTLAITVATTLAGGPLRGREHQCDHCCDHEHSEQ